MNFSIRYFDGVTWGEAKLDDESVARIKIEHNKLSKDILEECMEVLTKDPNPFLIATLFNKRCPSFMELINKKLEERAIYKLKRTTVKITKDGDWMDCPVCKDKGTRMSLSKYYKVQDKFYKFYCGKCKKFKVELDEGEIVPERFQ